jgi:ribonuclease HI
MTSPADDLPVLRDELLRLELALAQRRVGDLPGGSYAGILHEAFHETGASGRWWARDATLTMLDGAPISDVPIVGFEIERLTDELILATYDTGGSQPARRVSLWVRDRGRWRIRFHQGTPLAP